VVATASAFLAMGLLLEEGEARHRVMLVVTCPEGEFMNRCGGGNQGITQLGPMAFGELTEVIAGAPPNLCVDRNASHGSEQSLDQLVLPRPRAMPDFSDGYW
jgi:hypothetical protein